MLEKIFSKKQLEILKKMKVVMMCGMVGSGKSYLAKRLALKLGAVYLSTDEVRWLEIAPYDLGYEAGNIFQIERFDDKGFGKVYKKLWQKINKCLLLGKKVIIDATFLNRKRKIWATRLGKKVDGKLCLVYVKTDINIILQRLKKRQEVREKKRLYEPGIEAVKYFQKQIEKGKVSWPKETDAPYVLTINNNQDL